MRTADLTGRTVAVAGGSSGVGLAAVTGATRLGARTIVVTRSAARGARAAAAVQEAVGRAPHVVVGDPATTDGARRLAAEIAARFDHADAIISAMGSVGERGLTASGVPRSFDTNYLTHFRFLRAMTPQFSASPDPRCLIVGAAPVVVRRIRSIGVDGVDPSASSGALLLQSLAWKLLLARFTRRIFPDGPAVSVFHPGLIRSNLLSERAVPLRVLGAVTNAFARTRCAVADHLVSDPGLAGAGGLMYDDRGRPVAVPAFFSEEHERRVWEASIALAEG